MHTTCPECSSVFRVTAEQLKMAEGKVRCGFCQTVFNAINSLEEGYNDSVDEQQQLHDLQHTEPEQADETHTTLISKDNLTDFDQPVDTSGIAPQVYQDNEDFPIDEIISTSEEDAQPAAITDFDEPVEETELSNNQINDALDQMLDLGEISADEIKDTTVIEVDAEEFESILEKNDDGEFLFDDDLDDEPSLLSQLASAPEQPEQPEQLSSTPMSEIQSQTEQLFREVEDNIKKSLQQSEQPDLFPHTENLIDDFEEIEEIELIEDISDGSITAQTDSTDETEHEAISSDAPPILRDELAMINNQNGHKHSITWALGIIVLSLTLATQMLYHFRSSLATDEPMRSVVIGLCDILSCEIPLRNDARSGIKSMSMFSHSIEPVAEHPDQLRIQAIFTNTANYTQAFPVLSLKLSDENNRAMAMRRFSPEEYLASHINIKQGLPAKTAIEVIIHIIKPDTDIVSYHFDFL